MTRPKREDTRDHDRARVTLKVQYRTVGSFLVSYSLNLSKGGLFLETADLLPVGTLLRVRFAIPGLDQLWAAGNTIETDATVAWTRATRAPDGEATGLGLAFERLDEQIGTHIDSVVRSFPGVTLMAVAGNAPAAQRLARQLCNTLTCSVRRCTSVREALTSLQPDVDLVLVDLDSLEAAGMELVKKLRTSTPAFPLLAVARQPELRQAAEYTGTAVLDNPPPQNALRTLVLELLANPQT